MRHRKVRLCKSPLATGEFAMYGSDLCRWHAGPRKPEARMAGDELKGRLDGALMRAQIDVFETMLDSATKTMQALMVLSARITALADRGERLRVALDEALAAADTFRAANGEAMEAVETLTGIAHCEHGHAYVAGCPVCLLGGDAETT